MATILLLAFLQFTLFPTTTYTTTATSTRTTVPIAKMTVIKDLSESIHIANASIESIMSCELVEKWQDAHDTFRLRFALPDGREFLGEDPSLPTCISVQHDGTHATSSGELQVLKKSYSPILHPDQKGMFDKRNA